MIYIYSYIYTYTILYFNLVGLNGMVRISCTRMGVEWDGWFFGTSSTHQHPEALTFASKDGLDEASSWGMGIIMNHHSSLHFWDLAIVSFVFSGCCRDSLGCKPFVPTKPDRSNQWLPHDRPCWRASSNASVMARVVRRSMPNSGGSGDLNPDIHQGFLTWEIIEVNGKILGLWTMFDCHSWMMGEVPGQKCSRRCPNFGWSWHGKKMQEAWHEICTGTMAQVRCASSLLVQAKANSVPPGRRSKRSWKPVTSGCWPVYAPSGGHSSPITKSWNLMKSVQQPLGQARKSRVGACLQGPSCVEWLVVGIIMDSLLSVGSPT